MLSGVGGLQCRVLQEGSLRGTPITKPSTGPSITCLASAMPWSLRDASANPFIVCMCQHNGYARLVVQSLMHTLTPVRNSSTFDPLHDSHRHGAKQRQAVVSDGDSQSPGWC